MKIQTAIACCLISLSAFAQKTYVLKQNYPIGKKYNFSINSDQIITQKINGQRINLTQNLGTDYTFDVANAINGDKNVKVIYNRIFIKSVTKGNTMILDSDHPDTTKQNPFGGLKGATYNMLVAQNGEIKSVTGIEKMLADMAAKMTKDTAQIRQIRNDLSKQFNSEMVKQTMESSFKIYPNQPVSIGDNWTVDTRMQMTMPIETITKYTLKAVKDGVAMLHVNGVLVSKGSFEAMGNKMETDLKGTNSGDVELDVKTGMIMNSHLRIELLGTMKSMGQDIDFELQGINKITGKEIK